MSDYEGYGYGYDGEYKYEPAYYGFGSSRYDSDNDYDSGRRRRRRHPYLYRGTEKERDQAALKRLCQSLSVNDPKVTEVKLEGYPEKFSDALGQALVGNTHVTSLHLDLNSLDDGILLRQIQSSPSLNKVVLMASRHVHRFIRGFTGIAKQCFQAINGNSNITELSLIIDVPAIDFNWLMRTTRTLRTLNIVLGTYDATQQAVLGSGLASNQSVERLVIQPRSDSKTVQTVLWHLQSNTYLRDLVIERGRNVHKTLRQRRNNDGEVTNEPAILEALASALSFGTMALVSLCLVDFNLEPTAMKNLVDGVRSSSSLEQLVLRKCVLSYESVSKTLVPFMREQRGTCALRDLVFDGTWQGWSDASDNGSIRDCWSKILVKPDFVSIGSSLQRLSVCSQMARGIWDTFAAHSREIRLPHLTYESDNDADWDRMLHCFPRLVHLQSLELRNPFYWSRAYKPTQTRQSLQEAMRLNVSLHSVTFVEDGERILNDGVYDTLLLRAYTERNAMVPEMLAKPHDGQNRLLFPRIYSLVQPVRPTRCRNLLIALMAMGDSIDPPARTKRPLCVLSVCPICCGSDLVQPQGQRDIRQFFFSKPKAKKARTS